MRHFAALGVGVLLSCFLSLWQPSLADVSTSSPTPSPTSSAAPIYSPTPAPPVIGNPSEINPSDYPYNGPRGPQPIATPPAAAVSPAPEVSGSPSPAPSPGFANVTADDVYGNTEGDMTALGHVDIKFASYDILADEARYSHVTKLVHATGHIVFLSTTGDTATASALDYDTLSDQVHMYDVAGQTSSINAQGQQIRGYLSYRGREVTIDSSGHTIVSNGWVTTCDLSHVAYHITGREIEIRPDDRVLVHGARLYLGRIVAGILGYMVLPLSSAVHKSTVLPRFGYNSYYGFYEKNYINFTGRRRSTARGIWISISAWASVSAPMFSSRRGAAMAPFRSTTWRTARSKSN